MTTAYADTRDHNRDASTHVRHEPLRDQVFAACGYAVAIAALAIGVVTSHTGRVTVVSGVVFAAVLVPVNVCLIRRFARLRRSLTAKPHAESSRGGEERTVSQRRPEAASRHAAVRATAGGGR